MMRFPSEKSENLFSNPNTDFDFFLNNSKTETKLNVNSTTNVDPPNCSFYHIDPPTPAGVAEIYIKRTLISIPRWDMTLKRMHAC